MNLMCQKLYEISEDYRDCPGPLLELKGSVRQGQKGHPTLLTQFDNQFKQVIHFTHIFTIYCVFSLCFLL